MVESGDEAAGRRGGGRPPGRPGRASGGRWIGAALLLLAAACGGRGEAPPRAVILLVGDGMGISQITFARLLERPDGGRFAFESLPVTSLVSTRSASNPVTDSGAAATSLAAGIKTLNQVVGVTPEGRPVTSIADVAREHGWKIGYVTTTAVTHATPAAFYAGVTDRYADVDSIALQLLDQAPEVALGGGLAAFLPRERHGGRQDGRDLLAEAEAAGYTVWTYEGDPPADPPRRLLGLLAGGHLNYELDRDQLAAAFRTPPLEELTRIALDVLSQTGAPFFLLVEGGRIDHAAHGFDARGVGAEVAAFDRAVEVALGYQRRHPDTLVLVTADHATGGLAINDYVDWDEIGRQESSNDWIIARVRDEDEPAGAGYLNRATGYDDFTEADAAAIRGAPDKYEAARVLGRMLADRHGITWIPRVNELDTKGHTGEDVPLYAGGPGAGRFQGVLDQTDVPRRLAALLGWELPPP